MKLVYKWVLDWGFIIYLSFGPVELKEICELIGIDQSVLERAFSFRTVEAKQEKVATTLNVAQVEEAKWFFFLPFSQSKCKSRLGLGFGALCSPRKSSWIVDRGWSFSGYQKMRNLLLGLNFANCAISYDTPPPPPRSRPVLSREPHPAAGDLLPYTVQHSQWCRARTANGLAVSSHQSLPFCWGANYMRTEPTWWH